ncbi:MAG: CorA family divalent cation transporter [Gaiellaceae bacterium]
MRAADGTNELKRASACEVIHACGAAKMAFNRETVERLLESHEFFWLDLDRPTEEDFGVLRRVFKFYPLAVEDSEQFDQRAKIDVYDDFALIVVYGARPDDQGLVEVHCFYSERFLVTVHREACPAFNEIRKRYQQREKAIEQPSLLLYRVIDGQPTARDLPDEAAARHDAQGRDTTT